jgi:hypothetical protein
MHRVFYYCFVAVLGALTMGAYISPAQSQSRLKGVMLCFTTLACTTARQKSY